MVSMFADSDYEHACKLCVVLVSNEEIEMVVSYHSFRFRKKDRSSWRFWFCLTSIAVTVAVAVTIAVAVSVMIDVTETDMDDSRKFIKFLILRSSPLQQVSSLR